MDEPLGVPGAVPTVLGVLTHDEGVIPVDVETLVSLVLLIATIAGSHAMLRRDLKADINGVSDDVRRLEDRVNRLDDRGYGLAVNLKPLIEQAERQS